MKSLLSILLFAAAAVLSGACIVYPAKGNIQFEEGTLEMLIAPQFDPAAPPVKNMEYHGTVFQMDLPGDPYKNHFVMKFWKRKLNTGKISNELRISLWVDGKGQGGPSIPVGSWKKGEFHHIAMVWNKGNMTMFSDGKAVWKGKLNFPASMDPAGIYLLVGSRALWWKKFSKTGREKFLPEESNPICVAAVKISADARTADKFNFKADKLTLLLDDYRKLPAKKGETKPIVISEEGRMQGMIVGRHATDEKGIYLYNKKDAEK